MDLVSAIVAALVAGATAALKDTAGQAINDAYKGLKDLLIGKLSSLATLEQDPTDEDYQRATAKELEKKKLAGNDEVLRKARELLELAAKTPPEQLAASGIDIRRVTAASDILIRNIESRGGIVVKDVNSGRKIDISDLRGGGPEKN